MSAAHLIFVLRAVLILVASKPQSHLLVLRRFMIRGQCDAAKQNTEQTVQDFDARNTCNIFIPPPQFIADISHYRHYRR